MPAPTRLPCPTCGRDTPLPGGEGANRSFPFCSPACKLVDLGRWLDGSYRVPGPLESEPSLDEDRPRPTGGEDE